MSQEQRDQVRDETLQIEDSGGGGAVLRRKRAGSTERGQI